jgi:DNA transformation protein and related proteins
MSNALVDHCLELLAPLGAVRARRMFGGHGIYIDDLFVAVIGFERLYLKTDAASRERFKAAGGEPFFYMRPPGPPLRGVPPPEGERGSLGRPGASSAKRGAVALGYWTVPAEAMESPALMQPWARQAIEAALRARAAKPAAPRSKTRATKPKPKATASRTRR